MYINIIVMHKCDYIITKGNRSGTKCNRPCKNKSKCAVHDEAYLFSLKKSNLDLQYNNLIKKLESLIEKRNSEYVELKNEKKNISKILIGIEIYLGERDIDEDVEYIKYKGKKKHHALSTQ